jgi:hypothetical protein
MPSDHDPLDCEEDEDDSPSYDEHEVQIQERKIRAQEY